MENYYRQQYGGDFAEVREDTFVGPSDGQEAVPEDAGQGDYWEGSSDWNIPQEEQQEQGSVEGEYDPGFVPEGGYNPGSEYEGGYDPVFTWGSFEDDVVAEELVDAPAADAESDEVEQPLEDVGRADAGGQEPNDAPDPSGGTPPPEYVEQAGADSEDGEIEMPPEDIGRSGDDAGDPEIEMYSDDAGQVGAGAGDGKIEMSPEDVWENAKRIMAAHEKELAEFVTYDELVDHYKYTYSKLYERHPDVVDVVIKLDLSKSPNYDTYEELKAATRKLLAARDAQHDYEQQLEARYAKDLAANPDFQHYEKLADYYKDFHMKAWGTEPSWAGLDTYEKLKIAVFEAWRFYDSNPQERKDEQLIEEKDESHMDDSVELPVVDSGKHAPEIEMPPDYVGRTGADVDGQEPNDAPDPLGGMPPREYVEQASADAGDAEIEMGSDDAGRAGDPLEKYRQQLEVRYGKEWAQDNVLVLYEVELAGMNAALDYYIRTGQGTWETHVRIATQIHEWEQKRDLYLEKMKAIKNGDWDRVKDDHQKDDHHIEGFVESPLIDSDKDPASESIEDAGETVGDSYGYGDYLGW